MHPAAGVCLECNTLSSIFPSFPHTDLKWTFGSGENGWRRLFSKTKDKMSTRPLFCWLFYRLFISCRAQRVFRTAARGLKYRSHVWGTCRSCNVQRHRRCFWREKHCMCPEYRCCSHYTISIAHQYSSCSRDDWFNTLSHKVQEESKELPRITDEDDAAERDLHVTEDDLLEAKELAATYTLEEVREVGDY